MYSISVSFHQVHTYMITIHSCRPFCEVLRKLGISQIWFSQSGISQNGFSRSGNCPLAYGIKMIKVKLNHWYTHWYRGSIRFRKSGVSFYPRTCNNVRNMGEDKFNTIINGYNQDPKVRGLSQISNICAPPNSSKSHIWRVKIQFWGVYTPFRGLILPLHWYHCTE